MKKPENSEAYGWYGFIAWCDRNGVDYEACDEWEFFWECWKAGYCERSNGVTSKAKPEKAAKEPA